MIRQFEPAQWLPTAFSKDGPGLPNTAQAESVGEQIVSGSAIGLTDSDVGEAQSGWPRGGVSAGMTYPDANGVLGDRRRNSPPGAVIEFDRPRPDVDIERDRHRGICDTDVFGPMLFARAGF